MVLLMASLTMKCPRKKNEDEGIKTRWFLKPNDRRKQPEIIEAVKRVEERNEKEAEAKREEQARQNIY